MLFRIAAALVAVAFVPVALAQSADQRVVSAVGAPDPVVPGQSLTYTVVIRNDGPDPAVNGGLNINLPLAVELNGPTVPAGWSCAWIGHNGTCSTPSFAPGTEATITIATTVGAHLLNFADGTIGPANFFPSGTTADPNPGNNQGSVTVAYDSPQVDLAIVATDSPDPVGPDGDITYTVDVSNQGPDAATAVNVNFVQNNSLRFRSLVAPAGYACTLPAVDGNPQFTCTRPSFAAGATHRFTLVVRAYDEVLGVNDGSVVMGFGVNGTGHETDHADNTLNVTTQYVTPDADLSIAVTDSPDPVAPDGTVAYTATVTNAGPDAASNATFSIYNDNSMRFQSISAPSGFSCQPPAVGGAPVFSCTAPTLAVGVPAAFTVVLRAPLSVIGPNDTTLQAVFTATAQTADPAAGNNTEIEATAYVAPDADLRVSVVDAPDPAAIDGVVDFLVTMTNAGPDDATQATLSVFNNGTLRHVGLDAPSGYACTTPAVGGSPTLSCTTETLASGATVEFVVSLRGTEASLGVHGGTVQTSFSVASPLADPLPANNTEVEATVVRPDRLLSDGFE